jgi:hydrogenase nickel incorporation protein HypA/HybF
VHEMGLCEAIVDATVRRAAGRPVSRVRVRVTGHPVDRDVLDMGFRLAAAGTVAESAAVDVVVDPPAVRCRGCGALEPAPDALALAACRRCGGIDVEIDDDGGVALESITYGAAAASETA